MNQSGVENTGNVNDVRVVIGRMQDELQTLMVQRDEVMRKICTVKKTVAGLVTLFGEDHANPQVADLPGQRTSRASGLSAECRLVLMNAERPLSAREIRDRVIERWPSLRNHRDSLASITTILNRLMRYGEACHVVDPSSGRRRWAWITEQAHPSELHSGNLSANYHNI